MRSTRERRHNGRSITHVRPEVFRVLTLFVEFQYRTLNGATGKVIEQMVKTHYLVEFPAQKKEPKWFQNLDHFKKNSSAQWPKKSPKNWTGPCLSLNMVRRNRFIKWQTPARNAKSSFEGANPTPSSPMQRQRPPARTTIESKRTVARISFIYKAFSRTL